MSSSVLGLSTWWLGRATIVALVCAVGALIHLLFYSPDARGRRSLREYTAGIDRALLFLRLRRRGLHVVLVQIALLALIVALGIATGMWSFLVLIPLVLIAPRTWLLLATAKRMTQLEAQLEGFLNLVAAALKASPSLGEAIASTVPLIGKPMSEEIDLVVKEYELGTPLDRALDAFSARVTSKSIAGSVLALKVARRSGGNLPEMLESAASALRELARLEGVVRTKTAEGKAQALVVGVLPAPMILLLNYLDPRFFDPLLQSFKGNLVLGGAGVLWLGAILVSRKVLSVDV